MDAHRIALRRFELLSEREQVEAEWTSIIRRASAIAEAVQGVVQSLPAKPVAQDGLQGGGSDRPLNRYNRTSLSSLPSPRPAPFPKSEPLTHGKHSGSHRRRQMLREGSDHALARWRDVPPLLVGRGHQEWPG